MHVYAVVSVATATKCMRICFTFIKATQCSLGLAQAAWQYWHSVILHQAILTYQVTCLNKYEHDRYAKSK